uniref:HIT-type domain-containing protein n=2 Tax=Aegilops tauschii TaxID=37682 RepID=A0A453M7V5_AEGTS
FSSYPPPREKCAGPSCPNPYKYRDSKTKLPLCSLECYKAVQGGAGTMAC